MTLKAIQPSSEPQESLSHQPKLWAELVLIDFEADKKHEYIRVLELGKAAILSSQVELVRGSEVEVDAIKKIEHRRSAHEVGFGLFRHNNKPDPKGKPRKTQIALKPFSRPDNALHEVFGYLVLQELGVETFEPIGVFPAELTESYVVVTKKRNDLTSLDRDRWVVGRRVVDEATSETALRNNASVQEIAKLQARINANGVFHPDGQIKNYAKTPKGTIGIIDTENLIFNVTDADRGGQQAWADIEKLVKSLIVNTQDRQDTELFGVGMLYGLTSVSLRRSVEELIINPYLDELCAQQKLAGNLSKSDYINGIYESVAGRFLSDTAWPSHLIGVGRSY